MSESRRGWVALAAVSLAVFSAALDLTVAAAVLPQLIFDFDIALPGGLADASWIVNGYLIAYLVTMPIMGRVSDLFGRRLVFLLCLAIFTIGSIWAALVNSLWWMVAARVIQALGGGAMVPVAFAAVTDAVAPRHRPLAIGTVAAVDTAGWVAGATYGAWITTWLGWRWVFWLNVPISVVAALLVFVALPEGERKPHRLDVIGALLLTLFLLAFTIALYLSAPVAPESGLAIAGENATTGSPWNWPLLALSLLLLATFLVWERRSKEPLFDPRLLAERLFLSANSVSLLTGVILMAVMSMIPVLLQSISMDVAAGTEASGRLLALFAAGMMAGSLIAGSLLRLLRPRPLTVAGLLLMAAALQQLSGWQIGAARTMLAPPLTLAGLGLGLVTTPLASAVLERVTERERGIAASLLLVARLIGMALGLSVLVTWALQRFDGLMEERELPGLFEPDAATRIAQVAAEVTTVVVTDLFLVTAVLAAGCLIPALWLSPRRQEQR